MKKILFLVVAAAACGGPAQDDFAKATPSFDAVALDISAADAVPENFDASAMGAQSLSATDAAVDGACQQAGISKSRLGIEVRRRVSKRACTRRRYNSIWKGLAEKTLCFSRGCIER